MPNPITYLTRKLDARRSYDALSADAYAIRAQLSRTPGPDARANLLYRLAEAEHLTAIVYPTAFGLDVNPHDGGRSAAESIASGAQLIRLLAGTEQPVLRPNLWTKLQERLNGLPVAESMLWGTLALTVNRRERAEVIEQIAEQATRRVGLRAADSLRTLAETERAVANSIATGTLNPHIDETQAAPEEAQDRSQWGRMPAFLTFFTAFLVTGALILIPMLADEHVGQMLLGAEVLAGLLAVGVIAAVRILRALRRERPKADAG